MSKTFPLQVLKINETIFNGDAVSVTAPGTAGEITVLADHETMLTSLKQGSLCIRTEGSEQCVIDIENGFMEATRDHVVILL